ncbi:MAG TPA: hypothetical protein VEU53_02420 [Stellaceae bacterium]|nr:hypothetical protein [Stellaceae bacterium]
MSAGLAIFLVGLLFATVYLYSITRTQWNWRRIAKFSALGTSAIISVLAVGFAALIWGYSGASVVVVAVGTIALASLYIVTRQRWNWPKIVKRARTPAGVICALVFLAVLGVSTYRDHQRAVAEQEQTRKAKREERARACNAAEIKRLEPILARANDAVTESMTLDDAKKALDPILGMPTEIDVPSDNIKQKVLVGQLQPKCDSAFYYLINVIADEQGKLTWFRVWAENAPEGYSTGPFGSLPQYTSDYGSKRSEAAAAEARRQTAAQQALADELRRKQAADQERQREVERDAILRSLSWLNFRAKCSFASFASNATSSCGYVEFSFAIKNNSNKTITSLGFGWDLYATRATCPKQLSTKARVPEYEFIGQKMTLRPGESKGFDFTSELLPTNYSLGSLPSSICFKITDVRFSN